MLVACGAIYLVLGDVEEASMLLGFVFVVMGIGLDTNLKPAFFFNRSRHAASNLGARSRVTQFPTNSPQT